MGIGMLLGLVLALGAALVAYVWPDAVGDRRDTANGLWAGEYGTPAPAVLEVHGSGRDGSRRPARTVHPG